MEFHQVPRRQERQSDRAFRAERLENTVDGLRSSLEQAGTGSQDPSWHKLHRLDMPVLVHDREAHDDVGAALLAWDGRRPSVARGVLHAYSGDGPMARRLSAAGYLVSFALPLAFRSASGPQQAARILEDGRFLVETDAPYLGPDRERTNEPTTTLRVVAELAHLRGSTPEALVAPIREAYRALIG